MADERALAIIDIDGVVADVRHRVHFVEQRPKDWDAFFAAAVNDTPHDEGLAVVETLAAQCDVIFLTGRPEHLRDDTQRWLEAHGLGSHRLVMRPEGDRGPSARFKVRRLQQLARNRSVAMVVDDDEKVIAAMKEVGFPTLHAAWEVRDAGTQTALFTAQEVEGRT